MATAAALTRLLRRGGTAALRRFRWSAAPHLPPSSTLADLRPSSRLPSLLRTLASASAASSGDDTSDGRFESSEVAEEGSLSQYPEMKQGDWICSNCDFMNFGRNLRCLKCKADGSHGASFNKAEMRVGDWTCPSCDYMNFARNMKCLRCRIDRPGYTSQYNTVAKKGDWICPKCNHLNFSNKTNCQKCNTVRGAAFGSAPFKRLDWNCPVCQYVNFSRNVTCLRCQAPRSNIQLIAGEWECPSCKFLNFRRNQNCHECNQPRPEDSASGQEDGFKKAPASSLEETLNVSDDDSGDEDIDSLIEGLSKLEDAKS